MFNLRGLATAFVLAVHSSLAYLASVQAQPFPFDRPPYGWLAPPILDGHRWFGFDAFCACPDVYLMALLFFVSGASSPIRALNVTAACASCGSTSCAWARRFFSG